MFVLKKRVLVFESNQELVDMMDKYGSVQVTKLNAQGLNN